MKKPSNDDLEQRYRKAAHMSAALIHVLEVLRADLVAAVDAPKPDGEAVWASEAAEQLAEAITGLLPLVDSENRAPMSL